MKKIVLFFLIILLGNSSVAGNFKTNIAGSNSSMPLVKIDSQDTILFDLSNATVTPTYIDIPVSIISDDVINALDFALKYDHTNITYDSIINLTSYFTPVSYYNTTDSTLRLTSNSFTNYAHNTPLVLIRFFFNNPPCGKISKTDLFYFEAYLNGYACSYKITDRGPSVPTANFTTGKICTSTTVTFNDASTVSGGSITSWSWNFGNGNTAALQNPTTTYSSVGNYTVTFTVTANSGCTSIISKSIKVNPLPVPSFTSVADCKTGSVAFTNNSTIPAGTINSWTWNFGDAGSSNLQNPSHIYISAGTYTVSLTAVSDSGCTAVYTSPVFIKKPTAKFAITNFCFGSTTNFTDSSITSSGTINSWKWYFGDGNTSVLQNSTHVYTSAGTYTVSLKITSSTNCSDSISKTISIQNKPIVKFVGNVLSGCSPLIVSFSDSSITAAGSNYFWNFGDSDTSSLKNNTHTYKSNGTYTVKHYVTTSSGCADSLIKTSYITVVGAPVAKFKISNGCLGSTASFTDSSTISSGTIINWKWNFGDGTTNTLQNPSHIYVTAGTYTVSLKITSNTNCFDSIAKTIIIGNKPVVNFSGNDLSGCAPLNVIFSDSSITTPGSVYFWNFGDGGTSSLNNSSHKYMSSGTYTVKHIVTTASGCSDSLIKTSYIIVKSTAKAKFTAANGCVGSSIYFTDSSSIASGTIIKRQWYFGDGNTSPLQNPSYIYASAGTYTVSLKITTSQNCSDSIAKIITIESKPLVKFAGNILSGCMPLQVIFLDSSVTAAGSNYVWNFGDSGTSLSKNSTHTYIISGIYTVKHYVTTSAGCSDSLVKIAYITVSDNPTAFFSASPLKVKLPNATIDFTNLSKNYVGSLWNFGDSILSNSHNPFHTFINVGIYKVCLTVENAAACPNTYCDTITVLNPNVVAIPSAFTPNDDNSNDILKVRGGPMAEMEFRVFNEWGNQVFFSTAQNEGWDGTFKGTPQPEGGYEYTLKGKTIDNEIIKMHGVVTLVR